MWRDWPSGDTTTVNGQSSRADFGGGETRPLDTVSIGLTRDDTIFTASARTVDFNGQALIPRFTHVRASHLYDGNDRVRDPERTELTVATTSVRAVFGLHEDATLAVYVPHVSKELKRTVGGRRERLRSDGLGDIQVLGKWRFFSRPEVGATTEAAVLGGLELPTGRDDVPDGGERLPQPLQPGSGSVDGILGAAFTQIWDGGRWVLNADAIYKANSEANDFRFGNILRLDAGAQYRVYPVRYERSDQTTLNAILELNWRHAARDNFNRDRIDSSGGSVLFASPGVQVILGEDLLLEAGVQIPVYRDLRGPQLSEDFRVTLGLRWRF